MSTAAGRILIVEGDPGLGLALELLFSQRGHQVEVVASGELALDRMGPFAPHVVVMEARLPFRSSFDICHTLHSLDPAVRPRILILTARDREAEVALASTFGVDAFLTKPFSSREMLETVQTLLP